MSKSDQYNGTRGQVEYYSDFQTNLSKNPVTGLLAKVTNEESVKSSIRNLILTTVGERFYNPGAGSKINALLFDPIDSVTESLLEATIKDTIGNYEPRAKLLKTYVVGNAEKNLYEIQIFFSIINIPESNSVLPLTLKRIR